MQQYIIIFTIYHIILAIHIPTIHGIPMIPMISPSPCLGTEALHSACGVRGLGRSSPIDGWRYVEIVERWAMIHIGNMWRIPSIWWVVGICGDFNVSFEERNIEIGWHRMTSAFCAKNIEKVYGNVMVSGQFSLKPIQWCWWTTAFGSGIKAKLGLRSMFDPYSPDKTCDIQLQRFQHSDSKLSYQPKLNFNDSDDSHQNFRSFLRSEPDVFQWFPSFIPVALEICQPYVYIYIIYYINILIIYTYNVDIFSGLEATGVFREVPGVCGPPKRDELAMRDEICQLSWRFPWIHDFMRCTILNEVMSVIESKK